jgi:hypothetical protein
MPIVEIWDGDVQLGDLLDQIPSTNDLKWSIMEFWGVARDDDIEVMALEREASGSPCGLKLSGEELRGLASHLVQLVDGIVAGYRADPPTRYDAGTTTCAPLSRRSRCLPSTRSRSPACCASRAGCLPNLWR